VVSEARAGAAPAAAPDGEAVAGAADRARAAASGPEREREPPELTEATGACVGAAARERCRPAAAADERGPDGLERPAGPRLVEGMPEMMPQAVNLGNADAPA
jgi:hypothetical protein